VLNNIAWVPCECCDEYICNAHGVHAADCECPVIETWAEDGRWPYDDEVNAELIAWLDKNKLQD